MEQYIQLEKSFIQNEFIQAPPIYSVIYIYLLNKTKNNTVRVNLSKIEDEINISVAEIFNCLKYFDRKQLLSVNTELSGDTVIVFGKNKEIYNIKENQLESKRYDEGIKEERDILNNSEKNYKKNYKISEIKDVMISNEEISELFSYVEEVTGQLLNGNDLSIVYSFYDYYKLPVDVIHFMIAYCVNNNKRNLKYIEKVAMDWSKNGIKNLDDADRFLTNYNKEYKQILDALGVKSGVVEANKEIMDKWLIKERMPVNLIIEACKKTVLQTGGSSLKYVESILEGWKKENVKTIEDMQKYDENFKQNKKNNKQVKQTQSYNKQKPKFTDYQQRNLDFDKLQREAMKKKFNN